MDHDSTLGLQNKSLAEKCSDRNVSDARSGFREEIPIERALGRESVGSVIGSQGREAGQAVCVISRQDKDQGWKEICPVGPEDEWLLVADLTSYSNPLRQLALTV